MDLSTRDLVCLGLAGYGAYREADVAPETVTVSGLDDAMELGDSVADRVELFGALETLQEEGLVERRVRPVEGAGVRRRAYFLTEAGRERATRLRERLAGETVTVTNGTTEEVTLGEIDRYFEEAPLVRALARLTDDRTVPLERYGRAAFVDRSAELDRLEAAVEALSTRGGHAVLVTGEAGVGKTALVEEFRSRLRERDADPVVGTGACEADAAPPYRVFREAFADLPAGPRFDSLLDEVATLPGEDPATVQRRRRTLFVDIADAVRGIAEDGPLVLVFEDLQWAEGAAVDLLDHLVENVGQWVYPVLFLATYRPAAVDDDHPVADLAARVDADDRHERVALSTLSRIDTRRILERTLGVEAVPEEFVDAVDDHTGGNPSFVEESAKHLAETGAVDPASDEYPTDEAALPVSETVADAVERRLEALDATGRAVLELGAVVGETVPEDLLAAASDLDRPTLRDYVDLLVESAVWERADGDPRFVNGAVRRTTLDRLDPETRRALHARVATAMESVYAGAIEEHYPRIAHHHRAAGDAGAAVEYYRRAGERAADVYAHEAAVDHYETALELAREAGSADEVATLARELAEVHLRRGEHDAAERHVGTARAATDGRRDDLAALLGRIAYRRSDYETALATVTDALDDAGGVPTLATCELLDVEASTEIERGEYDRARETACRQRDVADALGADDHLADAHARLGSVARERGEYDRAREHYEAALATHRAAEDRYEAARMRLSLGSVALNRNEYDRARDHYEAALETMEEVGDPYSVATARTNLGVAAEGRGEYDRAREHLEAALSTYRDLGQRQKVAETRTSLGIVAGRLDDEAAAREHFRAALSTHRAVGNRHRAATVRMNLGVLAVERGDTETAREQFERALETHRAVGDRHETAKTRTNLGGVALLTGEYDRAREHLEAALDTHREVGDRRWTAKTRKRLGELATERGEYDAAREHLTAARSTFEEVVSLDDVLGVMESLVETASERGDPAAARDHAIAALDLIADSEGEAAAERREWFRERRRELGNER